MKKRQKSGLLFLGLLLVVLFSQTLFASSQNSFIDLTQIKWEYRWGDTFPKAKEGGWQEIDFPSNPPKRDSNTNVWYRVLIPEDLPKNPTLFIFSVDLIVEVYFQEKRIYSFGTFDENAQGKFEGWPWHMIEIPQEASGEYLYFRVYSDYPDIGLWGEISLASKGDHLEKMLAPDLLRLSSSAIVLFLGLLFFIGFFVSRFKVALFLLSSLFITQGLDLLLSAKIVQIYFDYPLLKQYILAFSYFYLPVGIAAFLEQFIGSGNYNLIRRIWQIHLVYIALSFSVAIIGLANVSSLYVYFDLINYSFTFPILSVIMILTLIRGDKDQKIIALGLFILSISWAYSSLISWGFIPWQEHPNYLHIFLCLFLFTYVVVRKISHAQELEVANKKLSDTNEALQEAQKELTRLATFDALSGLYNRNKINEYLESEIHIASRYKESFGIILLDIDDFKNINDTFGHLVGDEVLVSFSSLLKIHVRQTDIVGRWGGEEFLVLFRKADLEDTQELAQKLCQTIQNHNFLHVRQITASFGVSVYQENDTMKTLFERVDKALYRAKELGKNRVEIVT